MKDENRAVIELDNETGALTLDEELFGLQQKPYTVRKLLLTYTKSREFLEQFSEVLEDITER